MIAKLIRNYDTFVMVLEMPEGIRRRRSLARFQKQCPTAYGEYMTRYELEQHSHEPEPEQKPKRGRRKKPT